MSNFKPTNKFKIIAILSCAIIIIGFALGTVFHFVSNGFFNYGGEYSSYKSVTVSYLVLEINAGEEKIDLETVCEDAFNSVGVSYYLKTEDSSAVKSSGQLEYRFTSSTDSKTLKSAVEEINNKIKTGTSSFEDTPQTRAVMREQDTIVGGGYALKMAAIALACIVAVQLIYTMIRFRLSAAFTAIAVDLHNLALFSALLALCRVPVSSTVMVFAVLVVLATAIGVTFTLDRIKSNMKDSSYSKLSVAEVVDLSAGQTLKANIALPAFLAVVAVILFAVMALSAMSLSAALTPALLALAAFAVTVYGTVLFAPAIYNLIKNIGAKQDVKPSQKKGN